MQPNAVLTRAAVSHVRVGTFQYLAVRGDAEALRLLTDHVIAPPLSGVHDGGAPVSRAAGRGGGATSRPHPTTAVLALRVDMIIV